MSYLRRRPRIPPTGQVTVRLTPAQRDLFIASPLVSRPIGHALHRSPVREGKLTIRVNRVTLEQLIAAAANVQAGDDRTARSLATLLRYLESLDDRFDDADETEAERAE